MTRECENDKCEENCTFQIVGDVKTIDSDKYSTMYKEHYQGTCAHCKTFQEFTKEYWENNETGDITGIDYK